MENWYWIELIGFDNETDDYGVSDFINRLPRLPDGISLLFSSVDFVNNHDSVNKEYFLQPCDCSYGARKCSDERSRQKWTNLQLRGLIKELKKYGIKVLLSFFNFFTYGENGTTKLTDFCAAHKELWDCDKNGNPTYSINVLKTLKSGTPYEDFLLRKCSEVVDYYDFDGIQVADGISSARPTIQNGDFSDDLVRQFLAHPAGAKLAGKLCENAVTPGQYRIRRKIILSRYLYDWILFLSERWQTFYKKLNAALRGKTIFFNSVWTCDPFEALYRYGFDYKKALGEEQATLMVEEVSPSRAILSKEDQGGFDLTEEIRRQVHYRYMLMQLSLKTALPNARQVPLTPVNDSFEQWNVIEHAFTELQRAILRRCTNYVLQKDAYVRCTEGSFFCLSDSMTAEKWKQIDKLFFRSDVKIKNVLGFTALWSDHQLYGDLKEYIAFRDYAAGEYYKELLANGLDISSMAKYESLQFIHGPVLAANIHTLAKEEREALENYKNSPLLVLGKNVLKRKPDFIFKKEYFTVALYNMSDYDFSDLKRITEKSVKLIKCSADYRDRHGAIWTAPLKFRRVNRGFFQVFAKEIMRILQIPQDVKADCKVTGYRTENNKIRLIISNDEHHYNIAKIKLNVPFRKVCSKIKGAAYEFVCNEDGFSDRIPPRGMDVVEVDLS